MSYSLYHINHSNQINDSVYINHINYIKASDSVEVNEV